MFEHRKQLRFGVQGERAGERFFKELSEDPLKEGAFGVGVSATLAILGKADEKNVKRAVLAVVSGKLDKTGPFQRAHAVLSAVSGSGAEAQSIRAFLTPLWEHGFDIRSHKREELSYDQDIARALAAEGIILDYAMPPAVRASLRRIGERLAKALEESALFRDGLALLEAGQPRGLLEAQQWLKKVAAVDRDVVIAVDATRRAITSLGFSAGLSKDGGKGSRVVGPTGWSISCVTRQVLADAFLALNTTISTELIERTSKLVGELKFRDYYVEDNQFRDSVAALKNLSKLLGEVSEAIVNRGSLFLHRSLIDSLADLPSAEEATRAYLCAPPPHQVFYKTSVGEVHVDVVFTHSLVSVQLYDPKHEERCCRWTIGSDGNVRTWGRTELLPVDAADLGIGEEEYSSFCAQVERASLALLKELSAVWEEYPGLYAAVLPSTAIFGITRRSDGIEFLVARSDVKTLLRHLDIDESHVNEGVAASDGAEVAVVVKNLPAPADESPLPEAADGPIKCPINAQFVAERCPQFGDFLRELRKFEVSIETGHGSHQLLRRAGHHYTVSKNQRDGTLLMNRHLIRAVLRQLEISEEEFVARATRRSND